MTTHSAATGVPPVIERWLEIIEGGQGSIEDLLADDAVFYSPAVFSPQRGRELTAAYLRAAEQMFHGTGFHGTGFHYVEKWFGADSAVLHFAAEVTGPSGESLSVEGIDMIHWNAEGKITSFKVMIRPFKALQAVIGTMAGLLAAQK